jgi:hypothetical protein
MLTKGELSRHPLSLAVLRPAGYCLLIPCFRYNGLPPGWVASLASVGYSEEEIEAINYRRANSRAPSTVSFQHPNFPNLPSTSQLSISTTTTQNHRDRVTPSPSMHRQPSQASIQSRGTRRTRKASTGTTGSRQSFYQSSSGNNSIGDLTYATDGHLPPLPLMNFNDTTHKPKKSIDTLASTSTNTNGQMPNPLTRSKLSHDLPPTPQSQAQTQAQSQPHSRPSQSRAPSKDSVFQVGKTAGPTGPSVFHPPKTPPRGANQTLRVINEPLSQSPPPAYHLNSPLSFGIVEKPPLSGSQSQQPQLRKMPSTLQRQVDEEPRASVISTCTVTPGSDLVNRSADQGDTSELSVADLDDEPTFLPELELSMSSLSMSPPVPAKKKKRYSLAPPRLSLGQDAFTDIGSWGDGLFGSIATTTTTAADGTLDVSTGNGLVKKSAPVIGGTGVEEERKPEGSLSADAAGSNFTSTSLTTKGKEREREKDEKKEPSGPHGLTTPLSSLISPPLTTQSLPTQTTHQPSQPPQSQTQPQVLAQSQLQSAPTPPPKTAPVIPIPQPLALSASTSSLSSISTSGSNSQSTTRVLPSTTTTKATDRFTPSPTPSLARGRTGNDPPKSADPSLRKITSTSTLPKSQPKHPRERSSSRASTAHRPLPPQKPLPTLSLMSPIPLPNPPSHVELKSKISTVSLKTAAKRDKEREEAEKVGKVGGVEKKEQEAVKKEEPREERWPMTAKETIELMASINHDNDGLDFGGRKENQDIPALPDLNEKTSSASLDPRHSYGFRDSHLSVDSTNFDPDRLSSISAGSRSGLKLIIEGSACHNDNRDSNVSTSTITNATIVSGPVEVATRARADLVASPVIPNALARLSSIGSPSPTNLAGEHLLGTGAGSRETTPKQDTPSISNVDLATDDERSRVGGRSPSPGSSTHSHSSSSATTLSSTGPSSLSSANKTAGFTRPVIKQDSGWEREGGARGVVASSSSSSSSASPYKSEFDDESGGEEDDDDDDNDDEIVVGDEEEDPVITRISPPPDSQKGSTADLVDEITGHRRPSLVIPSLSSDSLAAHGPPTNTAAVSQILGPFNGAPLSAGSGGTSPAQRYPGWISNVLSGVGLETFVDEKVEPRDYFEGLTEVAEGESGFVYQAKVVRTVHGSRLTKRGLQPGAVVAIKAVPILPTGSTKLEDLKREVEVMKRVFEDDRSAATSPFSSASGCSARAGHVLIMEAMYVDLQEDALWIRMELMERSLADVVALVEEGHLGGIDEKVVARFASDVSIPAFSMLFFGGRIDRFASFFSDGPSSELPPRFRGRPSRREVGQFAAEPGRCLENW